MIDDDRDLVEGEETGRSVEEVIVTASATTQRIVVPAAWGTAGLLASAERGSLLLYGFADMPHLLCWRLPDDEDVLVELLSDDDPRASELEPPPPPAVDLDGEEGDEEALASLSIWLLPADIDEEQLRYPARWGRPSPLVDAWIDGGPLLLAFEDGRHLLRWELAEDVLLSLIADDSL